jgi:hypothetical protein
MQHLHRVTDPWTSKAAADSVKMKIAGLERMIVETIAEHGADDIGRDPVRARAGWQDRSDD